MAHLETVDLEAQKEGVQIVRGRYELSLAAEAG